MERPPLPVLDVVIGSRVHQPTQLWLRWHEQQALKVERLIETPQRIPNPAQPPNQSARTKTPRSRQIAPGPGSGSRPSAFRGMARVPVLTTRIQPSANGGLRWLKDPPSVVRTLQPKASCTDKAAWSARLRRPPAEGWGTTSGDCDPAEPGAFSITRRVPATYFICLGQELVAGLSEVKRDPSPLSCSYTYHSMPASSPAARFPASSAPLAPVALNCCFLPFCADNVLRVDNRAAAFVFADVGRRIGPTHVHPRHVQLRLQVRRLVASMRMSSLQRVSSGNFSNSHAWLWVGRAEAPLREVWRRARRAAAHLDQSFRLALSRHHAPGPRLLTPTVFQNFTLDSKSFSKRLDAHVRRHGHQTAVSSAARIFSGPVRHAAPLHIIPSPCPRTFFNVPARSFLAGSRKV